MPDWRKFNITRGVLGAMACAGALLAAACSQQPSPDAYAEPPPPPPPRADLLGAPPEPGPAYRPEAPPPPREPRYAQAPPPYQPPGPQPAPVIIAMAPIPNPPEKPVRAHRGHQRRHERATVRVYRHAAAERPARPHSAPTRRSVRVYPRAAKPAYTAPARRGHAPAHSAPAHHAAQAKPAAKAPVARPAVKAAPMKAAPAKPAAKPAAPVHVAKAAPPVKPVLPKAAPPATVKPTTPSITLPAAKGAPSGAPSSATANATVPANTTAPTADRAGKLAALQMALTDTVAKTAVVNAPGSFTAGQPADVSVTIPAEFADTLASEAQKHGLADVASSVNLTALLSGDGFSVTPMDMQWRPLTPGQPTEFHWQVTAMNGAKGPLHADLGADMMGAGTESLSLGSLKVGAANGMKITPRVLGASLLVLIAAIVVAWLARGRGGPPAATTRRPATAQPAVGRPEPVPPPTTAHPEVVHPEPAPVAETKPHEPEPPPANDPEKA